MRAKFFVPFFFLVTLCTSLFAQSAKHPFTFEDMMKLKRVQEPVPSPDGNWVAFAAEDVDLEANTKTAHLWIVPASGGESKRLNETPNNEERPRFSPDGKRLIWTSKATDPTQIWMCDFNSDTGTLSAKPHQVTNISTGADGAIWSPDGKDIVFVSSVYPDCKDDDCNKQRDEELKKSKVKAKIFARLFYRHWNAFTEFKRSHLFVISADANTNLTENFGQVSRGLSVEASASPARTVSPASPSEKQPGTAATTAPRDLTPGDHDVPPFHIAGQDMYAISPDGQELAYTSNRDEVEATSTNSEIFTVPISSVAATVAAGVSPAQSAAATSPGVQPGTAATTAQSKKISTSPGADTTPLYSPDGKYLAWRSQARAGFESDKWRLLVQDRQSGKIQDLTEKLDHSVGSYTWTPFRAEQRPNQPVSPIQSIIFSAEDHGDAPLFLINLTPAKIYSLHADDLVFLPRNGGQSGTLYFTNMSIDRPNEIWSLNFPGEKSPAPLTHMNDALLAQIEMQPLESFTFKGANDEEVQGFMVKPPGFDPNKKYPLKFLIHGGPQGEWGNSWTYRWNAELFAANGYVVVMINFHGSTGYGQKFTDSISGDWGGKPYVDLMKGLDYVEKTYAFIDKNREAALGASYGGYMANWLLGHTNRFKCIVSHDGMFNAESAYGTTEELWFPNWEFGGPPWKNREKYRRYSPHEYAANFKTPTLVVHGQLDYRIDVSQGFDLFTTLQVLKVPSKMLYFPDEGHWVLKPQNSRLWYKTVNDWVDQWCKR